MRFYIYALIGLLAGFYGALALADQVQDSARAERLKEAQRVPLLTKESHVTCWFNGEIVHRSTVFTGKGRLFCYSEGCWVVGQGSHTMFQSSKAVTCVEEFK